LFGLLTWGLGEKNFRLPDDVIYLHLISYAVIVANDVCLPPVNADNMAVMPSSPSVQRPEDWLVFAAFIPNQYPYSLSCFIYSILLRTHFLLSRSRVWLQRELKLNT
jgi:hypothetical protein